MIRHDERDLAITWARSVVKKDFYIIDTETTGLDDDAQAVTLGIVSSDGRVVLDVLLDPMSPIPKAASDVHGISTEVAKKFGMTFFDILPALNTLFRKGLDFYAYNADFDWRILKQSAKAWERNDFEIPPFMDIMREFSRFYGEWNTRHQSFTWKKLTFAAGFFGIDTSGAHSAADDALMTLKVIQEMAKAETGEKYEF